MFDFKHRSAVRYAVLADLMRDKQGEIWTPIWKRIFLGYFPSFSSLLYGTRKDLQLVWQTQNQYSLQFKLLASEWQSPLFWDQLQVIILIVSSIVLQWAAASFASVYLWLQFGLLDMFGGYIVSWSIQCGGVGVGAHTYFSSLSTNGVCVVTMSHHLITLFPFCGGFFGVQWGQGSYGGTILITVKPITSMPLRLETSPI
jgi:hypothetical protein